MASVLVDRLALRPKLSDLRRYRLDRHIDHVQWLYKRLWEQQLGCQPRRCARNKRLERPDRRRPRKLRFDCGCARPDGLRELLPATAAHHGHADNAQHDDDGRGGLGNGQRRRYRQQWSGSAYGDRGLLRVRALHFGPALRLDC